MSKTNTTEQNSRNIDEIAYNSKRWILVFVIFLMTVYLIYHTSRFPEQARRFPMIILSLMLLMAAISLVVLPKPNLLLLKQALHQTKEGINNKQLAIFLFPTVLYLLMLEYIGYFPASLIFISVTSSLGGLSYKKSIFWSVLLIAFLYLIISYYFRIPI